jgi:hypothetical protein
MKQRVDKMVSYCFDETESWQNGKLVIWQLVKWQVGVMASWYNGKLAKWQVDRMAI